MIQKLRVAAVPYSIVVDYRAVHIPAKIVDLESFRQWTRSEAFPEEGRICYLAGEVWVDVSMEQLFFHNQIKQECNRVLGTLAREGKSGRYIPDGMRLTHVAADLSCEPDALFVSTATLRSNRVRLIQGKSEGIVELEGTPDMVLEILSDSSVIKDTERLYDLYHRAAIPEYWLIDVREERLEFNILRNTAKGYVATRKQAGWLKSKVFGKSFRLTRESDALGHPEYTLDVR